MRLFVLAAAGLLPALPALAHPGDHTQVDPVAHTLGSADHLMPVALIVVAGLALWRWSRR